MGTTSILRARAWPMVALALLLVAVLLPAVSAEAVAGAPDAACETRNNNTIRKVLDCMTADGAYEHLQAFQDAADANTGPFYPGTRAAGTSGYADSVAYVADTLEAAGWDVTLDPVEAVFTFPATLQQLTPVAQDIETGVFTGSGSGAPTAAVEAVDLALSDPASSTSGCEASDFSGFTAGNIALVQRGACFFSTKAVNAEAAGASAIIIFNQGNTPERSGLIIGNAANLPDGSPSNIGIPVVGASFADGVSLSQPGSTAFIEVIPSEIVIDHNVIAELPGRNADNVVMAGAHLDSVVQGPGVQDNGSGSAALLELAQVLGNHTPDNTLRFGWWAAEEQGLVGSESYVANLSADELDRIAAYVNFDMIASPNYVFFVYDADESSFPAPVGVPIPDGSIALERLFETYYTWQGIPYEDTQFSGRSDYQAFIESGVPASGLFTGAEVVKTPEQEAIWGGTAGAQFDPCYHLACDTIDNASLYALDVNIDAVAFAVMNLAYSTEDVNGVPGRDAPGTSSLGLPTEVDGPQGTFATDGGDAHEHDADE